MAVVCAMLLAAFIIIAWYAAVGKSATFDEPVDVVEAWANTRLGDYRISPGDPPLWSFWAGIPLGRDSIKANFAALNWRDAAHDRFYEFSTDTLYRTPGNDADALLRRCRAMMLILGALTCLVTIAWGWRIAGPVAAVVAGALVCLDPNLLAHAPLVKNDVSMALVALALFATAWAAGRRATVLRVIGLGLLCGAAVCVKYTGLLLGPALVLLLIVRATLPLDWIVLGRSLSTVRAKLGAAGAIALACIVIAYAFMWGCYRFRAGPSPNPADHLESRWAIRQTIEADLHVLHPERGYQPTAAEVAAHGIPLSVRCVLFAEEHRLLPEAWTNGLILTYRSSRVRESFLLGQISLTGWWYYFPLAMLFKTPVATLLAAVLALWLLARGTRRPARATAGGWWTAACLILPPLVIGSVAMSGNLDIGIRHVLSIYPFAYIAIGIAFARFWTFQPRAAAAIGALLAAGLAIETAAAFPNYIPFFNAAVGGARGGISLLSDSNIDWGQDLRLLADWQRRHPDRPIYLCYFGRADPAYYGIHYINLPGSFAPDRPAPRPAPGARGVIAMSATPLQGVYLSTEARRRYAILWERQPLEILGGSIYLYDQDALSP
jgi:hypothetical protein